MLRLNLASGTDIKDGWVNLDIVPKWPRATRGCDVIWDARKDRIPFGDNTVDEIYAGYLLLHLAPMYHTPVLAEIHRVLAPTGSVIFGEVDMEETVRRFIQDPFDSSVCQLIWGEQGMIDGTPEQVELADYDKHCHGFTEKSLLKRLQDSGFGNFQRVKLHVVWYELSIKCQKA